MLKVLPALSVCEAEASHGARAPQRRCRPQHAHACCGVARLHTSAYVSIRKHTPANVSIRPPRQMHAACARLHTSAYASIRQHTSAYVLLSRCAPDRRSISKHTPAYVSIRQHTSSCRSIRQHTSSCRVAPLTVGELQQ
jgi:hypothetical protein